MPSQDAIKDTTLLELEAHNAFFDAVVDMIPAKLYVHGPTGDEQYNPKYLKGQHKESKESRRARNKAAKKAKFDPSIAKTTLEVKRRQALDDDDSDDDDDDETGEPVAADNRTTNLPTPSTAIATTEKDEGQSSLSRIEILRAKLRAKILEKQAMRPNNNNDSTAISKRAARRAEKARLVEAAKQRPRNTTNTNSNNKSAKVKLILEKKEEENDLDGIDYGAITGLKNLQSHIDNKSLVGQKKRKKSLEMLLEEAEKKKARLKELKAGSQEETEKAAKIEWSDTLKEASGEKLHKNDPAMLKKAMKQKAKKKAKSAEAWKTRMEQTKDKVEERQKIRNYNLDKRKAGGAVGANLSRKRIVEEKPEVEEKRPRLGPHSGRAGFEGKKQDFINKGDKGGDRNKTEKKK